MANFNLDGSGSNIGAFLSSDQAEVNLVAFLTHYNLSPADPNMVCGHVLGLTKIYEFLKNIEDYNADNPNAPVDAVRIYQARSEQIVQGRLQEVDDIFLMPILSTGEDLYPVYPPKTSSTGTTIGSTNNILGNSRPCPNICN